MSIEEIVKKLPADLQEEVKEFARFLLEKRAKRHREKPKFDWAGALKGLKGKYTSVELQHKISEWRIGER